jgi:CDK-activating kinase assembly factor MAT1
MTMNLVLKTDVKKTEAALNKYKEANAESIKANSALERNPITGSASRHVYQKEEAHLRRQASEQQHQEWETKVGGSEVSNDDGPISDPSGLVKGLKRIRAPPVEKAYDPFMGMATTRDYYELQADYPSIRLTKAKNDTRTNAGGFDLQAYFDESLLRAFAGLGCFIDEERVGQGQGASGETAAGSRRVRSSDDVL